MERKVYHNVINNNEKKRDVGSSSGAGGIMNYLADVGKMVERPISGAIFLFSLCKICLTN